MRCKFGFGGASYQPKGFLFCVIEDLAQQLGSDENATVPRHRERLLAVHLCVTPSTNSLYPAGA